MHYGREFLSVGMWDSDKAQHLRETCARVSLSESFRHFSLVRSCADEIFRRQTLGTWGMGSA